MGGTLTLANKRNILLIIPSIVMARGIERIFADMGEFQVAGILQDLSRSSEQRLHSIDAEAIILDPGVLDYQTRQNVRSLLSVEMGIPLIAFPAAAQDEESLRQYDAVINLYDEPASIIRKIRATLESESDSAKSDGNELSAREKEILVCVAKGMLNKEIADLYNISIYTVITHRKNISRKTGIKTVAGLTVYALLNNLIDMNSIE